MSATKLVNVADLPAMDATARAKDAKQAFQSISLKPSVPLWLQIFWAYRWQFLFQWTLTCFSAVVDAAPQYAVLRLLQYLEARDGVNPIDPEAWLWVGCLLLATLTETVVDNRIGWLMWSDLAIPIRLTLTSLIFEKMLKSKDCKEPPKREAEKEKKEDGPDANGTASKKSAANGTANGAAANRSAAHGSAEKKTDSGSKEDQSEPEKNAVNMFTVDTNLSGHMAAMSQYYIMFVSKFLVTIVFLLFLVGWQSLLAGMVATALFYPVNKYLVTRYQGFQKALMKIRDRKTTMVTEALTGIRQIKFSALEEEWGQKLTNVRQEELDKLWETKINNLYMTLGYELTPVFLTVFALATYSYIHGALLPSIAFTALAVFMQLEGVLSWIPLLAMIGINGKVSTDRIDKYLKGEDKIQNTYPGHAIAFDNASFGFPAAAKEASEKEQVSKEPDEEQVSEEVPDRFALRDISLQFPNKALSIISGPTGCGKSLLLAAILGEVDLHEGSIIVPRAPPEDEFFDDKATAADWTIPAAIAFVSQQPWIENATIKNNILFGLPFDAGRYVKTIKACALSRDFDMLEDGDQTEVGAQGITLSGGQRWRVTLARAIYSRAGILILDDVFSALDAHVGRDIYENALMGELSAGRTRILATHHVSLCLPRAEYAVKLSARGTLEFAGSVKELQETEGFEDIVKPEEASEEDEDPEENPLNEADPKPNGAPNATEDTKKPKKLVEDEKRETGNVKKVVYAAYLKATGGVPFWVCVLIFYMIAQALILGRSWWIKLWTATYENPKPELQHMHGEYAMQTYLMRPFVNPTVNVLAGDNQTLGYYLGGYILLSLISSLVDVGRYYLVYRGALRASKLVFQSMTYRVLRTPMRWLDTVPTGRILNRFTADFQSFDSALSSNFAQTGAAFLSIIGIMVST